MIDRIKKIVASPLIPTCTDEALEAEIEKGKEYEKRLQREMYITLHKDELMAKARVWMRIIDIGKKELLESKGYVMKETVPGQYIINRIPEGHKLLDDIIGILAEQSIMT